MLISIVSKPIKVVIVVVVFVKRNRSKNFLIPKQSMSKKIRTKSVGSKKNLGQKKVRSQKVLVQKLRFNRI